MKKFPILFGLITCGLLASSAAVFLPSTRLSLDPKVKCDSVAEATTGSFVKITATGDLTDGDYLIVYEDGNVAFNGALKTLDAANNTIAVTITEGSIPLTDDTKASYFSIDNTAHTIMSASGFYIGRTATSNGLSISDTQQYTNTIEFDNGDAVITASSGTTLRYNKSSDQKRFRYYTSGQQAVQLYKFVDTSKTAEERIQSSETKANLSYKYNTKEDVGQITDKLDNSLTGISGSSYTEWEGKQSSSSAVYAGQSAGENGTIQLRSKNSNSGIITTTSGGLAKKITVEWNSTTTSGRTIDIYGKTTAYSSARDLYDNSKQGTKIGSIVYGASTELTIEGEYTFIGLRSNNGALYLDKVQITWEAQTTVFDEISSGSVAMRFGGEISITDWQFINNGSTISDYGVMLLKDSTLQGYHEADNTITTIADAFNKEKNVTKKSIVEEFGEFIEPDKLDKNYYLFNVKIGFANDSLFDTIFHAQAYMVVDGQYYFFKEANEGKGYSVKSLAQDYIDRDDFGVDYNENSFEGSLYALAHYGE